MSTVDLNQRIPNNVDLASDRRLRRALEQWQPAFLDWWREMGPVAGSAPEVYLRTATSVDRDGWANFGFTRMPDYRWGVFLADPEPDRRIGFGDHRGEPVWQQVPGDYRAALRRLIVIQGDTEPASVEQQRHLGRTCPSGYDLRNLFQINVEEGRHLWAMVYLLHACFGRDGREEAQALLERRSRRRGSAPHPHRIQRAHPGLARALHVHLPHRPRRQVPAPLPRRVRLRPPGAHLPVHAHRGGAPHVRRDHRSRPGGAAHLRDHARARHGRRGAGSGSSTCRPSRST